MNPSTYAQRASAGWIIASCSAVMIFLNGEVERVAGEGKRRCSRSGSWFGSEGYSTAVQKPWDKVRLRRPFEEITR